MIEELLKNNSTKTIEALIKAAPDLFNQEIAAYNKAHPSVRQSFQWQMINKKADEALLEHLFELDEEWKYFEEAARYYEVDFAWLKKEHLVYLYWRLEKELKDKRKNTDDLQIKYPAFIRAIKKQG